MIKNKIGRGMGGFYLILFMGAILIISTLITVKTFNNDLKDFCESKDMVFVIESTGFFLTDNLCIEIVNGKAVPHEIIRVDNKLFIKAERLGVLNG